jgi:hypothetical protein
MTTQEEFIRQLFHDPDVQKLSADIGTFYILNTSFIGGGVIATNNDINILSNNKVITPYSLNLVLKSAGGGGLYPVEANFQSITTSKILIADDIIPSTAGGTGFNTYNDGDILLAAGGALTRLPIGVEGQILSVNNGQIKWTDSSLNDLYFATADDVFPGTTADKKLMSPTMTQTFMLSPPIIGYTTPNDAIFNNVTINGTLTAESAFASSDDAVDYTINNKILSPSNLSYSLSSPPPIGDVKANDASFKSLNAEYLTVDNPPWPITSETFATNQDTIDRNEETKALTPANILTLFSFPAPIGDGQPTVGYFTDLTAASVTVDSLTVANPPWPTLENVFASDQDIIDKQSKTTILCPANIPLLMANPGPIGSQNKDDAFFNSLTAENLTVTNPPWQTLDILYATNDEVFDSTITNKSLSPSNLPTIFSSPPSIGSSIAASASFTNINVETITITNDQLSVPEGGTGIASYQRGDILVASDPTTLSKLSAGQDGQFLQVQSTAPLGYTWTTLSGSVPEASTDTFGVVRYASDADLSTFASLGVVTVNKLPSLFASPPAIGTSSPNPAKFSDLSVTGQLSLTNTINANQGGTGISLYSVGDLLYANTTNSLARLSKGNDTYILQLKNGLPSWQPPLNVTAASTTNQGLIELANDTEVISYSEATKAITSHGLGLAFGTPPDIGSVDPANGIFNDLTIKNQLTLGASIFINSQNGGTGFQTFNDGDLLIGNKNNTLSKFGKGTVGQILQISPTGAIEWGNNSGGVAYATTTSSGIVQFALDSQAVDETLDDVAITPSNLAAVLATPHPIGGGSANTAIFTDLKCTTFELTNDLVQASEGGTGLSDYSRGDLLVASNASTLTKLSVENDGQVLVTDSTQTTGLRWSNLPLPLNYISTDNPRYQTSTTYTLSYCYCSATGTDIIINSLRTIDITAIGVTGTTSGIAQSAVLSGTVSVNGTTVTHDQALDFSTLFIVGDIITILGIGSRRIAAISMSTITVESAFASNNVNRNYFRGGRAPNSLYYLYALAHPTTPGYILSTRSTLNNNTFVDIPQDYPGPYRQLPYVFSSDGNSNFNYNSYTHEMTSLLPHYKVNPNMLSTGFSTISLSAIIPRTSTLIQVHVALQTTSSGGSSLDIGPNANAYNTICQINQAGRLEQTLSVPLDTFQSFVARVADNNTTAQITVQSYFTTIR